MCECHRVPEFCSTLFNSTRETKNLPSALGKVSWTFDACFAELAHWLRAQWILGIASANHCRQRRHPDPLFDLKHVDFTLSFVAVGKFVCQQSLTRLLSTENLRVSDNFSFKTTVSYVSSLQTWLDKCQPKDYCHSSRFHWDHLFHLGRRRLDSRGQSGSRPAPMLD